MVWITLERKVSIPIAEGTPSHVGHICMVMYKYVYICITMHPYLYIYPKQ